MFKDGKFYAIFITIWIIVFFSIGFDNNSYLKETGFVSSTEPSYKVVNESNLNQTGYMLILIGIAVTAITYYNSYGKKDKNDKSDKEKQQ